MVQDVLGFLKSSKLDQQASYVRRGRDLSDDVVVERRCVAFEAHAEDVFCDVLRKLVNDLDSELRLRAIAPRIPLRIAYRAEFLHALSSLPLVGGLK